MRIRIKQSRPCNLNQAICLAVELEAFYKAEQRNDYGRAHLRSAAGQDGDHSLNEKEPQLTDILKEFSTKLDKLQKELDEFKTGDRNRPIFSGRNIPKKDKNCYNCGNKGHFKYECPEKTKTKKIEANESAVGLLKEQKLSQW